jgi:hypothetical protein
LRLNDALLCTSVIFSELIWRNYEESVAFSGMSGKVVVMGEKMVFITNLEQERWIGRGEGRLPDDESNLVDNETCR